MEKENSKLKEINRRKINETKNFSQPGQKFNNAVLIESLKINSNPNWISQIEKKIEEIFASLYLAQLCIYTLGLKKPLIFWPIFI